MNGLQALSQKELATLYRELFACGQLVAKEVVVKERSNPLWRAIVSNQIPTYYQCTGGNNWLFAKDEKVLEFYIAVKKHKLIGIEEDWCVFDDSTNDRHWSVMGVSADWFSRMLFAHSTHTVERFIDIGGMFGKCRGISEVGRYLFEHCRNLVHEQPSPSYNPLPVEQLEKLIGRLFKKDDSIYEGTWATLTNLPCHLKGNVQVIAKNAVMTNQIPAFIQQRSINTKSTTTGDSINEDDGMPELVLAKNATELMLWARENGMFNFHGIGSAGLPTWRLAGTGMYVDDESPYVGHDPNRKARDVEEYIVMGMSVTGYEILLELERTEEVLRIMRHSTGKEYTDLREVAMDLYVAVSSSN